MSTQRSDLVDWLRTVLQSAIGLSLTQEGECGLECKEKLSEEDEGWGCRVALIQASAFGAGASLGGGLGGAREVRGERLGGKACCSGGTGSDDPKTPDPPASKRIPANKRRLKSPQSTSTTVIEEVHSVPDYFTVTGLRTPTKRKPSIKPRKKKKPRKSKPLGPPTKLKKSAFVSGEALREQILRIIASTSDLKTGTRVWVKSCGFSDWPAAIWSLTASARTEWPGIIQAYATGKVLVLFYGERMHMWTTRGQISEIDDQKSIRISRLRKWGQKHGKSKIAEATLEDLESSLDNPIKETERLQEGYCAASSGSKACDSCGELGSELLCSFCTRWFHPLCVTPPYLTLEHLLVNGVWRCPGCSYENKGDAEDPVNNEDCGERTGLTPDWVIQATAYSVFQLQVGVQGKEQIRVNTTKPSTKHPYIPGLLDPCTNSKLCPNIPAEKLYDKEDNGLRLGNSWKGYYVLLNPDYKAQVQWRFVNRAIDEVENGNVPAVVLVSRNSTDTGYYQRLRPYPRVLLRRQSIKFKNYENTPIGFGIVVFCIAREQNCQDLFGRFVEAFAPYGEPNMAVDEELLLSPEFPGLLERLREHAAVHQRDHWIQCSKCSKWRIVSYDMHQASKDQEWVCKDLRPPFTNCSTPQTRAEVKGVNYAVGVKDDISPEIDGIPWFSPSGEVQSPNKNASGGSRSHWSGKVAQSGRPVWLNRSPAKVACKVTLLRLATIPPRSNASSLLRFDPMTDTKGYEGNPVLTPLELARQAHEAANRAYLKGLGKDPSAIHQGELKYVLPNDALTITAARHVVQNAKVAEAYLQVQQAQRQFEAARRKRMIEEGRIKRILERLRREEHELCAAFQVTQSAIEELNHSEQNNT